MAIKEKKICVALELILSTLVFPWSLIYFFLVFPTLYTAFIAPFFLWKKVFNGKIEDISRKSFLWKIPTIILLYLVLNIEELSVLNILAFLPESLMLRILTVIFIILIVRIVTYSQMLWIWQPDLFKKNSKIRFILISTLLISLIFSTYSITFNITRYKDMLDLYVMFDIL